MTITTTFRRETARSDFERACASVARTMSRKGHEVRVVFEGSDAYTDGTTIVVPAGDRIKPMSPEACGVLAGYVDHETAHVLHTDMELYRREAANAHRSKNPLRAELLNAIEDIRIERQMMAAYPGARENLAATSRAVHKDALERVSKEHYRSERSILPIAVTWEGRRRAGLDPEGAQLLLDQLPAKIRRKVESICDEIASLRDGKEGTADAAALAKKWARKSRTAKSESKPEPKPEPEKEVAGESGGDESEGEPGEEESEGEPGEEGSEGDPVEGDEGGGESEGEAARKESEGEPESGGVKLPEPGEPIKVTFAPPEVLESGVEGSAERWVPWSEAYDLVLHRSMVASLPTRTYVPYGRTPNEAKIETFNVAHAFSRLAEEPEGRECFRYLTKDMQATTNVIRSKLMRALISKQNRHWRGGERDGRLDPKTLVAAWRGQERVFRRREEAPEVDTAVSLLIDCSGSMDRGGKIRLAQQAAIALSLALEGTGVAYDVLGFMACPLYYSAFSTREDCERFLKAAKAQAAGKTNFSRLTPNVFYIFKDYDETLHRAKAALGNIDKVPLWENEDASAVRWATKRLLARPESKRVLMVLSDGIPLTPYSDRPNLRNHLSRAVADASSKGVVVIGIGIMSEEVREHYPRCEVLHRIEDLPNTVVSRISDLILGRR